MIDHSSDFDARRIGWWARRGAIRQIRRSAAITDADRTLRLQQAHAAQTRGEINALTRGLSAGPAAQTTPPRPSAYAPPPQPPRPPGGYRQPPPAAPAPPQRQGSFRGRLLIGLVIALLVCGGGVVSCVSSIVDSVQESSSGSTPAPQTEQGWAEMIDAFDAEADLGRTVQLLVRRGSATLSVESGESTSATRYYYDGDVTSTSDASRDSREKAFDLAEIEPAVLVQAVAQARRSSGEPESTEAWVQVSADGSGPRILVTFPSGTADTYVLVVDADGTVLSERS